MKYFLTISQILLLTLICSCTGQKAADVEVGTQTFCFSDSCPHLTVKFSLELPIRTDDAATMMRDSLIADFMRNALQPVEIADDDEKNLITPYNGDMTDAQAIVDYYGKAVYEFLLEQALDDFNYRIQYLEEDSTMTAEEKEEIKNATPQWCFELTIARTTDAKDFVVYNSFAYVYYGGAHGGVSGTGAMTFNKATGQKISAFINADAANALQPALRKGLQRYYSECGEQLTNDELSDRLQLLDTIIPLPINTPQPNAAGDSLIFTYRQYEIACYADGMPSFAIAAKDLLPHLTGEGKAILNLE